MFDTESLRKQKALPPSDRPAQEITYAQVAQKGAAARL